MNDRLADYQVEVAASAAFAISHTLPEKVAWAVIEFVNGSLAEAPHRVGKRLRGHLTGTFAARRGAFQIVYAIDDERRLVSVLRIEHRADVYRPR